MEACNVRVVARFRPPSAKEADEELVPIDVDASRKCVAIMGDTYTLDHCFPPDASQRQVYLEAAEPLAADVCCGFNATFMAYGQTGSGKTFTMYGPDVMDFEDLAGVLPRLTRQVFETIAEDRSNTSYMISCTYLEVYRECVRDLLDPTKGNLRISESPERGVFANGATSVFVGSEAEVLHLVRVGSAARAVSATLMNDKSSRSHSIFSLVVTAKLEDGRTNSGTLNAVDLAGSEKAGRTGATGITLQEAQQINKSLSALGNVIAALSDSKSHVPYRDSKLTRLLTESLGGNSKTTLLVACSPARSNLSDTHSTLRFATRAKRIRNKVSANVQESAATLQSINEALKRQVDALSAQLQVAMSGAKTKTLPAPEYKVAEAVESEARREADALRVATKELNQKTEALAEAQAALAAAAAERDKQAADLATLAEERSADAESTKEARMECRCLVAELCKAELELTLQAQRHAVGVSRRDARIVALETAAAGAALRSPVTPSSTDGDGEANGTRGGAAVAAATDADEGVMQKALLAARAELASVQQINEELARDLERRAHMESELTIARAGQRAAEAATAIAREEVARLQRTAEALEDRLASAEATAAESVMAAAHAVSLASESPSAVAAAAVFTPPGPGAGQPGTPGPSLEPGPRATPGAVQSWLSTLQGAGGRRWGNVVRPAPIGPGRAGPGAQAQTVTGSTPLAMPSEAFERKEAFGQHMLRHTRTLTYDDEVDEGRRQRETADPDAMAGAEEVEWLRSERERLLAEVAEARKEVSVPKDALLAEADAGEVATLRAALEAAEARAKMLANCVDAYAVEAEAARRQIDHLRSSTGSVTSALAPAPACAPERGVNAASAPAAATACAPAAAEAGEGEEEEEAGDKVLDCLPIGDVAITVRRSARGPGTRAGSPRRGPEGSSFITGRDRRRRTQGMAPPGGRATDAEDTAVVHPPTVRGKGEACGWAGIAPSAWGPCAWFRDVPAPYARCDVPAGSESR